MEQKVMSKASEAQLRAVDKYNKEKMFSVAFRVNKITDKDVGDRLAEVSNTRAYLLRLIRKDIAERDEHRYFLHIDTTFGGNDMGRDIMLESRTEAEAVAEAKRIRQTFADIVDHCSEGEVEWVVFRAIKDEYAMSGYSDTSDPISID